MHDRNETTLKASRAGLVPIEIFDVLRVARWKRVKLHKFVYPRTRTQAWLKVSKSFGVAWDPVEMSYWLKRMLGKEK